MPWIVRRKQWDERDDRRSSWVRGAKPSFGKAWEEIIYAVDRAEDATGWGRKAAGYSLNAGEVSGCWLAGKLAAGYGKEE